MKWGGTDHPILHLHNYTLIPCLNLLSRCLDIVVGMNMNMESKILLRVQLMMLMSVRFQQRMFGALAIELNYVLNTPSEEAMNDVSTLTIKRRFLMKLKRMN